MNTPVTRPSKGSWDCRNGTSCRACRASLLERPPIARTLESSATVDRRMNQVSGSMAQALHFIFSVATQPALRTASNNTSAANSGRSGRPARRAHGLPSMMAAIQAMCLKTIAVALSEKMLGLQINSKRCAAYQSAKSISTFFFGCGTGKQAVATGHPTEPLRKVLAVSSKKGVFWQCGQVLLPRVKSAPAVHLRTGGKYVQLPCAPSAAMPMLSPNVGCG